MIRVNQRIVIPDDEVRFITARASGPGGQHVNTTDSSVTLIFDLAGSKALTDLDKIILQGKLRRRINKRGEMLVTSRAQRSQEANRREAARRLAELLDAALKPIRKRLPTRPTLASQERRLTAKKVAGRRKRLRRAVDDDTP